MSRYAQLIPAQALLRRTTTLVLAAALLLPALASAAPPADEAPPGRFIVGFHELPPGLARGDDLHGARVLETTQALAFAVVEAPAGRGFEERARADDRVAYLEEDAVVAAQFTPDDTYWSDQYGPASVGAPSAWNTGRGSTSVKLCVIDSGLRTTHDDVGGRYAGGIDLVNDDNNPWDDHGHGTHVSGIAAGTIHNGRGIAGVANVAILSVKTLSASGSGWTSDTATGIKWCTDNGADVINLSLGSTSYSSAVKSAVADAWSRGVLVVAAAGNDGCYDCVLYPAKLPEVIAVGCTTSTEGLCSFSSRGPELELAAPGYSILSLSYSGDQSYTRKSGTSMSSPHVAGVAALVWSYRTDLTNAELRDLLGETARDKGTAGLDSSFGHGIVDAARALAASAKTDPPGVPGDLVAAGTEPGTIRLTWKAPTSGGTPTGYNVYRTWGTDAPSLLTSVGTVLSYTDTGLEQGKSYRYYVKATNSAGDSKYSNAATAVAPEGTSAPGVPVDLGAIGVDAGAIKLSWSAPTEGGTPTGYKVYRTWGTDAPRLLASVGTVLSYTDGGLEQGKSYRYYVTALNGAGESKYSNAATAVAPEGTSAPGVPVDLGAIGVDVGAIKVSWRAPSEGGSPTGYKVYRTWGTDAPRLLASVGSVLSYTDTGLVEGKSYRYYVTALNGAGESKYSNAATAIAPEGTSPPGIPLDLVATGTSPGAVKLSWTAPGEGGAPTGYKVYRTWGTDPPRFLADLGKVLSFSDTGLVEGKSYRYYVTALNGAGESKYSNAATAIAPAG